MRAKRETQAKQYSDFLETQRELAATKIPEYSDQVKQESIQN